MAIKKSKAGYQGTIVNADGELVKQGDPSLVVDLPDGQKLIVGELPEGTIIEVATWRGTGRPDSRANRLLLGVGSAQSFSPPKEQTSQSNKKISAEKTESVAVDSTQPISKISGLTRLQQSFSSWWSARKLNSANKSVRREESNDRVYFENVSKIESETIDSSGFDAYLEEFMTEVLSGTKRPTKKSATSKKPAKKAPIKKVAKNKRR